LLERHHGNVDAASSDYYESQLRKLERELIASSGDSLETSSDKEQDESSLLLATSDGGDKAGDPRHLLRLQAAWDAVALFLPLDYQRSKGKVDEFVRRRLSMIAASCFVPLEALDDRNGNQGSKDILDVGHEEQDPVDTDFSVLDVGCGDGAILPNLDRYCDRVLSGRQIRAGRNEDKPSYRYLGIDVSPKMIALGRRQHPEANLVVGCFPDDVTAVARSSPKMDEDPPRLFDCVLFNGSLQFFADPKRALSEARRLLNPRKGSSIVVSHAMGSKFVLQECRNSPKVALSRLPDVKSELREVAEEMGMRLFTKSELLMGLASTEELGATDKDMVLNESDESDSNFYLSALMI
jgi:SAM-dependent methyltransferase